MHRSNVLRYGLYPALERAKLRRVDMHSLRHSFASTLIQSGAPINEVQKYMGHAKASTTLRVYTHFFSSTKADSGALAALGRALFSDTDDSTARATRKG